MRRPPLLLLPPLAILSLGFSFSAEAVPTTPGLKSVSCSDQVTLDRIENEQGTDPLNVGSGLGVGPTGCYEGIWAKNANDDQHGYSNPSPNIGQLNDGWLNGKGGWIDPTELVYSDDFVDVDGVGGENDPGWIHLANIQIDGDTTPGLDDTGGGEGSYSRVQGTTGVSMSISDLLTIDFQCKSGGCSQGTWSITTESNILESLDALGLGNSSFDHLLFSFKASTDVFVYDFDFNILDDGLDPTVFDYETPYNFYGTWNARDFANKRGKWRNLSHINIWARDPVKQNATQIPSPAPLALLGLGLLAMGVVRLLGPLRAHEVSAPWSMCYTRSA